MWPYIFIAIGVAVATGILLYLDSRLFDRPKKKVVYFKIISMTVAIVLATVYLLTWLSPTKQIRDVVQSAGSRITGGAEVAVAQIGETMLAGEAPF